MTLLQTMMVATLLVGGMGVALLGSIKVPLARKLQIDEARVGALVSVFGFVLIPVILTAGFLTDLVGRQTVLTSGCLLLAISLFALAQAKRYPGAFGAVLLLSTGWSLLTNVGNVLTPLTFTGGYSYAANLANVFFGIGAFLTPLLVAPLVRYTSLALALRLLGLLTLLPALLALGIDFAALVPAMSADTGTTTAAGLNDLLGNPVVWLCGLALFFYGPLEASLAAWATTYLGEQGVPETTAARLLSGFWLTYMLARLLTALTLPADQEARLILTLALAGFAVLLAMAFLRSRALAMALVLAAGLVFGPIFPTVLAVLFAATPEHLRGRAVGLFFGVGGIGWTLIPLLIGAYASRTSVQRGFRIAAGAAAGLSLIALLLLLREHA